MNLINLLKGKRKENKAILTLSTVRKIIKKRKFIASQEFDSGYRLIQKYPRSVSILGSARLKPGSDHYIKAEALGRRIVKDLGYAVVTGGGPGIMEAANKGAFEAGGDSLGFGIKLPQEQSLNKYLTEWVEFEYFFSRKTILFFSAESYVYYPGGFGTMDELFEILTLIQTNKIPKVPVILVGAEFWKPLLKTIEHELLDDQTIDPEDTKIYKIVDSEDEIIEIIKNAPLRQE